MDIRAPRGDEVRSLARFDREVSGPYSYSEVAWRQFYDLAGPLLLVAVEGGEFTGFSLILPTFEPGQAWFLVLVVRPDRRGNGIGRQLASAGLANAAARGQRRVRLTVDPSNAPAIALYTRLGFSTQDDVPDYFGPGERRLVMATAG